VKSDKVFPEPNLLIGNDKNLNDATEEMTIKEVPSRLQLMICIMKRTKIHREDEKRLNPVHVQTWYI